MGRGVERNARWRGLAPLLDIVAAGVAILAAGVDATGGKTPAVTVLQMRQIVTVQLREPSPGTDGGGGELGAAA